MNANDGYREAANLPGIEALLAELGAPGSERRAEVRRSVSARVREHEVTFNILGEPDGSARPWELDERPWVFDPHEFDRLSRGLAQRARLLNFLLEDLYGAQRLLRERVLPETAVYDNPHYFRAFRAPVLRTSRCTPPMWRVAPTGASSFFPIAQRPRLAPATRSRTA
jgi:uncharacterized circularly permuted ATP-grasp superfamily protein